MGQWCVLLWPLYEGGKYYDDLVSTHALGIAAATNLNNTRLRSLLLTQTGFAYQFQHELDKAVDAFEQARRDARTDRELEATALEGLGLAQLERDDRAAAVASLRENLALAEPIRDPRRIALAKLHLAKAESADRALDLLRAALDQFVADGDDVNTAKTRTWLGLRSIDAGRAAEAGAHLDAALATMNRLGRRFDQAVILEGFGDMSAAIGDAPQALAHYREALAICGTWRFAQRADRITGKVNDLSTVD